MDPEEKDFKDKLQERFAQLPAVVQNAITSADVEKHLRELADTHKLHLDQWEKLENEVMLALLGFQKAEDLEKNIGSEVGADAATAAALATDISKVVFEPIRQELERRLENPNAVAQASSDVEDMRTRILAEAAVPPMASAAAAPVPVTPITTAPAITPATPPPSAPTASVERAPVTPPSYAAAPSHERKSIEGDPYREQIG